MKTNEDEKHILKKVFLHVKKKLSLSLKIGYKLATCLPMETLKRY